MAKWLDKYEQGGLVLKKKTKDNYGKKPNVNDVKVSAGPGFEGDGYTAQNWKSPAWGGQFAMGGSLPGSVGFMYARTQNPAPANGKYTKKTLASAQDGMEMPKAELTPDIRKSKLSTAIKSGTQNPTATNLETDSFGQAYSKARKKGKTKFSYQGKDYSTKYKGTPEEQLKQTGITDAQLHNKNVIQEQLTKNLMPIGYDKLNAIGSLFTKNTDRKELEKLAKTNEGLLWGVWTPEDAKRRLDAFNLYSGIPQKYNTFSISKNKPSVSKDKDAIYYSITNDKLRKYLEERIATYDLNAQKDIPAQFREFDNSIQYIPGTKNKVILEDESGVMGNFTATLGKDEKGDYVSYYDKWDIAPKDFGKPMEIYDKIYLKDLIKDYKPKLQNGKALSPDADDRSLLGFNTPDPAFQNVKANAFVPFDRKDFEGIKQNIAGYMNSPLYMERLSKSIPDAENAKDVQQGRLNNLLGIKLNPDTVNEGTHYNSNKNRINLGSSDFVDNATLSHELAHGIVPNITNSYGKQNMFAKAANVVGDLFQPYEQFSNSELEKINRPLSGKITAPNFDYMMARQEEHYKPQGSKASAKTAANETYGDLTGMRQLLLDNGITTEFGQELTPEIFKKATENKRVMNSPAFQRMKLKFKDEDIIKMNNEVAYNNDNAPLDQAQNGKEMSFYQNGLDFKPKSISKKGKKIIKDDMGQWAHPGEITEIGSPDITMQGVDYPVLGISDTGDTQMMYPDQDYKFDGDKVTEFPMMEKGGWLDKYNDKAQKGKSYVSMKNDKDWFDSHANWSNTGNPKYDALVRESVLSGRFGLDPKTNDLIKLKESEWANVSNQDKVLAKDTRTWTNKEKEESKKRKQDNYKRSADEYQKVFNSDTPEGKALRKEAVAQSNKEMIQNPLFYAPAALAAAPFVAGAASAAAPILGAAMEAPIAGVAGLTGTNLMNAGFAYQASKNLPNVASSIKTAYQNPTLGNLGNAALETGLTTLDALPFASSVTPGVKAAINASKESGLLSNVYKVNPSGSEATQNVFIPKPISDIYNSVKSYYQEKIGEKFAGAKNRAAIKEGNEWFKNWIDDPGTKRKIKNQIIDQQLLGKRSTIVSDRINDPNVMQDWGYLTNYKPTAKEYPLTYQKKDLMDFLKGYKSYNTPMIHADNWGVSYRHGQPYSWDTPQIYAGDRTSGGGTWVSRSLDIPQVGRTSTTVHENTHDWLRDRAMDRLGYNDLILKNISQDAATNWADFNMHRTVSKNPIGYLADPTEVHARIMEARKHFGLTPGEYVSEERAKDMLERIGKGRSPISRRFPEIFDNPKQAALLFNRLPAVAPVAVGAGALATQAGSDKQKNGGWLDKYK